MNNIMMANFKINTVIVIGTTWILVLNFLSIHAIKDHNELCLPQEFQHGRRFLSYDGELLDLKIHISNRIPHQLVTAVLATYVYEVLGYHDIKLVRQNNGANVEDIMMDLSSIRPQTFNTTIPPVMINLEIPISADTPVSDYMDFAEQSINYFGDITEPSRYGWYIPKVLHNKTNIKNDWSIFTMKEVVEMYDLKEHLEYLEKQSRVDNGLGSYVCDNIYCINGTYTPDRCHSNKCGLLLTSTPEETEFVIHHIEELKLYMKVTWLGVKLPETIRYLTENYIKSNKSVVFIDWSPTHTLLADGEYENIYMPECEHLLSSRKIGCKYELMRMTKYGWSLLRHLSKPIHETITKIVFTQSDYQKLISYYNENKDISKAACQWMKTNRNVWKTWTHNEKENLYIQGMFPLTTPYGFGIATSTIMATEAINKMPNILENYNLILFLEDVGACSTDKVMLRYLDTIIDHKIYSKFIGVLGPACSEAVEPLAGMSKHYKTPAISYSAEGSSFSDREKYPYFFRTIGDNKQYKFVYYKLLETLGWHRLFALSEDGQKHTEYISYMESFLAEHNIEFVANIKFPEEPNFSLYLDDLIDKRAKIILADVDTDAARKLMCTAWKKGMSPAHGIVWFLPPRLYDQWWDVDRIPNNKMECNTTIMLQAIQGHFIVTHAAFAPDSDTMQENITVGEWKKLYKKKCDENLQNTSVWDKSNYIKDIRSPFAGYAYDAVWAYAYAMDKLLKSHPAAISDLHDNNNTKLLVKYIGELDFNGVSGNIKFRGGASRFSIINVLQFIGNTSKQVGVFYPKISETNPEIIDGDLYLNTSDIIWYTKDNMKPDDGTIICTFFWLADFLNIECDQAFLIFNVSIVIVLAILLVILFFFMKKRFERRYKKQIMTMGLNLLAPAQLASLDKWEIPRESIVINRKLGMGAFGVVYGGHALLNEEKGWTGVAVKTLKFNSTTDEKLDFLSEAESMKRFDHKNIVKLLAVVTKTEPVCTVMEFMLYGDLKNYLLSRRHLVYEKESEKNKKPSEYEEISCHKLTNMALDVARALSYLAELKYVHRDVASRNCLLNHNRTVKLGDFGMTRLIYDSDYYRFSRKGMLPVRWMAPESLGLGIFSQASDVWSFGVLLYEIITFGSVPYQGLSNSEVVDHVKNGNTVTLPNGLKPQLEGLIRSCWTKNYNKRPHASEIAEFLANNSNLLSPCLDVPFDSMNLDDSLQWQLLPEPGKVSINLSKGTTKILNHQESINSGAFSITPMVAYSTSTNLTYISTECSQDDKKSEEKVSLI